MNPEPLSIRPSKSTNRLPLASAMYPAGYDATAPVMVPMLKVSPTRARASVYRNMIRPPMLGISWDPVASKACVIERKSVFLLIRAGIASLDFLSCGSSIVLHIKLTPKPFPVV